MTIEMRLILSNGKKIELNQEEARELYYELKRMYDNSYPIPYPVPMYPNPYPIVTWKSSDGTSVGFARLRETQ